MNWGNPAPNLLGEHAGDILGVLETTSSHHQERVCLCRGIRAVLLSIPKCLQLWVWEAGVARTFYCPVK